MQFDGALQNGHIDKGQQVIGVPCAIEIDRMRVETTFGFIKTVLVAIKAIHPPKRWQQP